MDNNFLNQQCGIYIVYPTSSELKSIYRAKNYKTKVNNQHTKIGITKDSFGHREGAYLNNFDKEVIFLPIAVINTEYLDNTEKIIKLALCEIYSRVGWSREWFHATDRKAFINIILNVLDNSGVCYKSID